MIVQIIVKMINLHINCDQIKPFASVCRSPSMGFVSTVSLRQYTSWPLIVLLDRLGTGVCRLCDVSVFSFDVGGLPPASQAKHSARKDS